MYKDDTKLDQIVCNKCGVRLELGKVTLSYMGSSFPIELHKCPRCGLIFIPEDPTDMICRAGWRWRYEKHLGADGGAFIK